MSGECCVGAIVCKIEMHKNMMRRGYIAMLAVEKEYRRNKIGKVFKVKANFAHFSDHYLYNFALLKLIWTYSNFCVTK